MSDIFFILIIALVSIGIGFAIGSLVMGFRGERKSEGKSKKPPVSNLVSVANIMTDRGGKAVYLQVEGKVFRSPNDISREQRTRLTPFFEVLSSWFIVKPTRPSASVVAQRPLEQIETRDADDVVTGLDQPGTKRPSLDPVNILTRALQTDVKTPIDEPKSIAAQIDDILQENIKETDLEKRGVRLVDLPGKGVVVMVGLEQYEGVDEVPDEDVRNAIRSAVEEWERQ